MLSATALKKGIAQYHFWDSDFLGVALTVALNVKPLENQGEVIRIRIRRGEFDSLMGYQK